MRIDDEIVRELRQLHAGLSTELGSLEAETSWHEIMDALCQIICCASDIERLAGSEYDGLAVRLLERMER